MLTTRRPTAAQRERQAAANAALVRRVVEEAWNRGDLAVLDEVLAPPPRSGDHAGVRPEADSNLPVRGRLRELLAAFRAAVPDARWAILELVAEGDTVVTRLSVQGTFSGSLLGLAPPGRPALLTGVAISRFAEGRLAGLWVQGDLLGLLQQLSVLPPLSLAQAVTMTQVLHAGALLTDEPAPASARPPPRPSG